MSALGQKQTYAVQKVMSALPRTLKGSVGMAKCQKRDMILGTSTGGVLYVQTAATENG